MIREWIGYKEQYKNITLNVTEGFAMTDLHQMKCVSCQGDVPPLIDGELSMLHLQISEWQVKEVDGAKRLERVFKFKNFAQALEFTNKVGAIAEEEDHHPLIITEYGRVTLNWWTHKIRGLHKNDFIMAAKTDEIYG
jgi:4a-hydroxytetrahydrobiopterin dehydratase